MLVNDAEELVGLTVIGRDGEKLGTVDRVYADDESGRPEWAAVRSGLFGRDVSPVPLATAALRGDTLQVDVDKEALRSAPHHDPDAHLTEEQEVELFEHYGIPHEGRTVTAQAEGPFRDDRHGWGRHKRVEDDRGTRDEVALGAETANVVGDSPE